MNIETFMTNVNRVGVAGDWHISTAWAVMAADAFAREHVKLILHVGDFGLWPGDVGVSYLKTLSITLESNDQFILVTMGNHDDYAQFKNFEVHPTMTGFVYDSNYPRILFATRGARWTWDNVSFVSLGGAASIDYENRIEGVSWWPEERITMGDVYRISEGGYADVMITHDSPEGVNLFGSHREDSKRWSNEGLRYSKQSREMMKHAVDAVKPKVLFHGHYHIYSDQFVKLYDGLDDYIIRNVSLAKDGMHNNLSVLDLSTLDNKIIPLTVE